MGNERFFAQTENIVSRILKTVVVYTLPFIATLIIGCDEMDQMAAPVLDEVLDESVKPDTTTPPAMIVEVKQPTEGVAKTPEQQEQTPAQEEESVTSEPSPLSMSAMLVKSGERGSDVREGETVTLQITANRDLSGQTVQFVVDGSPEGSLKQLAQEEGIYQASFVASEHTPAGPITVRFADGEGIEVHEHLWSVKTHPPPPAHVKAPAIYTQWVDADGFPVVATNAVNPRALDEAAWIIKNMLAHQPGWLRKLGDAGSFLVILEHTKLLAHFEISMGVENPDYERRLRGLFIDKAAAAGEDRTLNYWVKLGKYYSDMASPVVHEVTHIIHHILLENTDFETRLSTAYNAAKEQGLWGNSYVVKNRKEYLAVGANIWFGERIPWLRKYVDSSRESLQQYDSNLADLLEEVFGNYDWRITPVRERLHLPHLQGYDAVNTPIMDHDSLGWQ